MPGLEQIPGPVDAPEYPRAMSSPSARERMSRTRGSSMSALFVCLCALLGVWLGLAGPAEAKREPALWSVGATPKWVEAVPGPADPSFAKVHASGGLAYDVIESQRRVLDGETWSYGRVVVHVLSDEGAETVGQQTFEFSPPNERLVLHGITIHRGDTSLDRLDAKNVQLLQREANLDQQIYDNRRTAFVLIPDLRVGDVLEYSWSVVGANPVMDGHVLLGVPTQRTHALGVSYGRVLSDRPLHAKAFGNAPEPTLKRQGKLYAYTLRTDSMPAGASVESVPSEEQVYGWVQFSDFDDWKSVAQWGIGLFETALTPDERIGDVLAELDLQDASNEARVLGVLNWVQRNVRYFSRPFAESTHRPTAPGTVLERRYGDCKDVALLTVALLRGVGVPAQVALVDSDEGRFVPEMLPSPYAFDHAVVVAFPEGVPVWLDPTRTEQRGTLEHVAARGLHWALPLAHDVTRLVTVEEVPRQHPDVIVEAEYTISDYDSPAALVVRAQYHGEWAHALRFIHDNRDEAGFVDAFESAIEEDLRTAHPTAEADGGVTFEDFPADGRVELSRRYTVSELWDDGAGQQELLVRPFSLYGTVTEIEPGREYPLALAFPEHRRHVAKFSMPDAFPFDLEAVRLTRGPLFFEHSGSSVGTTVELEWAVASQAHRVEVSEFAEYGAALDTINENFTFMLYRGDDAAVAEQSFNWSIAAAGFMWTLCLVVGSIVVIKRAPYLRRAHVPFDPGLVGLSGWLALVGLGLVASVLRFSVDLWQLLPAYSTETWAALTTPGTETYGPQWAPLLLFELLANLLLIVLAGLTLYAYFKKHRSFALVFIVLHLAAFLFPAIDQVFVRDIPAGEVIPAPQLIGSGLRCILWVSYALKSKRVRSTFLPPPEGYEPGRPWAG